MPHRIVSRILAAWILAAAIPAAAQPAVTFTQVPPCGSGTVLLEGTVTGVTDPGAYAIAPYIYTGSWWTKPTFAEPTLPLVPTGPATAAFSGNIVSHPTDKEAGYIVAFLVPAGTPPPQLSGEPSLPPSLFQYPYAEATRECDTRVLAAWGRAWLVKDSGGAPVGPGPNIFSDSPSNVFLDGNGALHLRIERRQAKWTTAEVVDITADPARSSPGLGAYTFQIQGDLDLLDPNVVLGLFTWDTYASEFNYREIDVEFARWGNAADPTNGQYVVQPWDTPGNLVRITMPPGTQLTTHRFVWAADGIAFRSWAGNTPVEPDPPQLLGFYDYAGDDVPPPESATANTRMNLWLVNGDAPVNGSAAEVAVTAFDHEPEGTVTGVAPEPRSPAAAVLGVAPSPFRGSATITLSDPGDRDWRLGVLDARGRRVRTLGRLGGVAGRAVPWDGRDDAGRAVASGVYWVVAESGGIRLSRKAVRVP